VVLSSAQGKIYLFIYLTKICELNISMKQNPSSEANIHSASQEIPRFYGIRKFITVFTKARYWSLSLARLIQSTPSHRISLRSILIFSNLCLGLQSGLFPSGFPTRILYVFLICTMRAKCPAHLTLLHSITLIIFRETYKIVNETVVRFLLMVT
jgi:hypothetical protein